MMVWVGGSSLETFWNVPAKGDAECPTIHFAVNFQSIFCKVPHNINP